MTLMMSLTACDSGLTKERRAEREEASYQKAMVEYKAGNLEKAVSVLEGVLRENPGNLSARFLLASLQQDRKDHLGAFCNFREFTVLAPQGEKSDMARSRMALCEEQLARELAKKMNLTDNAAIARESENARKGLQTSEQSVARLTKDLETAQKRLAALERENAQLRRMVSAVGADDPTPPSADGVKDILDDDGDDARPVAMSRAAELAADTEGHATLSGGGLAAAKGLVSDADEASGPEALKRTADESEGTRTATAAKLTDLGSGMMPGRKKADKDREPPHETRPDAYVVQEGDTLYKIAIRFYGNRNQWKRIREANKATISTDGRVKVGQRIVLP